MKKGLKCGSGHELEYVSSQPFGSFICNMCYQCSANSDGKLHCQPCDFDICAKCGDLPELAPKSVDGAGDERCPKGHPMDFSSSDGGMSGYSITQRFKCDKCLARGYLSAGRWWCSICCYDICHNCKAPPSGIVVEEQSDED